MFIVVLTYLKPLEVMNELRPAHIEFLKTYYAKRMILMSGRQNPPIGGLFIARGCTREELEAIIKEDPFYKEKAADYQIIEFTPNLSLPELSDLIKE